MSESTPKTPAQKSAPAPIKRHPFRRFLIWFGPIVISLILVVVGFVYWLLASQAGAQWGLNQAMRFVDGEISGVQGTVWDGLQVEYARIHLPPDTTIEVEELSLVADWASLWQRKLVVNELSAKRVNVQMDGESEDQDDSPFHMPELPIQIRVQHAALDTLTLTKQGEDLLPVRLSQMQLQGSLINERLVLSVPHIQVHYDDTLTELEATLEAAALRDPWPFQLTAQAHTTATSNQSLICADAHLPGLDAYTQTSAGVDAATALKQPLAVLLPLDTQANVFCAIDTHIEAAGSLEDLALSAQAKGQGVALDAKLSAAPKAAFPLRNTNIELQLGDQTDLKASLVWTEPSADDEKGLSRAQGRIESHNLDLARLLPEQDLPAFINLQADYDLWLANAQIPVEATLKAELLEGSTWQQQTIHGLIDTKLYRKNSPLSEDRLNGLVVADYYLQDSTVDLQLAENSVHLTGGWGRKDSELALEVHAPTLARFDEALKDIGPLELTLNSKGDVQQHRIQAKGSYQLTVDDNDELGHGVATVLLDIEGGVSGLDGNTPRWQGRIHQLDAENAGVEAKWLNPMPLTVAIPTDQQPFAVEAGAGRIQALLDDQSWFTVEHKQSQYGAKGWHSTGGIATIELSDPRLVLLRKKLGIESEHEQKKKDQRGGVNDTRYKVPELPTLTIAADWNLNFAQALSGEVELKKLSGDLLVPAPRPFPLELEELTLALRLKPSRGSNSQVHAEVRAATKNMGSVSAEVDSILRHTAERGFFINDTDPIQADVKADIDDLGWTYLLLGDALELQGALQADVKITAFTTGRYSTDGFIKGEKLRVTRLDDGVRLLDGTLDARFEGQKVILERLHFPAVLRVEPKEWRTAAWISKNPEAQDGYLNLTGQWDLEQSDGAIDVELYRYPILQRADRYAMVSGKLRAGLHLPHIALTGKIVADAGWFNLDMLGSIPTIDNDIIVLRDGETLNEEETQAPTDISMNIDIDLGPRFYLTGYGVNSGLVGQLSLSMFDGEITALGALRTRGGSVEQYGQRLLLRRGTVTFQGDITNPILDIEALRTGYAVEAGVAVRGTARHPRIDLVSYPDVDQAEKLSWLLFGHGSDSSSGDLALLLSVGSSLISGEEPLYRKLGIDEVTVQQGELGSAGSILPSYTLVKGIDDASSDAEKQFLQASKALGSNITVSLQQALSDSGTVGRASYRLARGLTAELSLGTVNGLALIYRWFSKED